MLTPKIYFLLTRGSFSRLRIPASNSGVGWDSPMMFWSADTTGRYWSIWFYSADIYEYIYGYSIEVLLFQ